MGGRSYIVRFDKIVNPSEIEKLISNSLGSAEVKTFGEANQLKITTNYKIDQEGTQVDNEIYEKLYYSLSSFLPDGFLLNSLLMDQKSKRLALCHPLKLDQLSQTISKRTPIWL